MTTLGATPASSDLGTEIIPGATQIYNVRDYGAVGDGVADDRAACQAAIDAAAGLGGYVLFPVGTYLMSLVDHPEDSAYKVGLVLPTGINLLGIPGGSVLKLAPNQLGAPVFFSSILINTSISAGLCRDVTIRDLVLDGDNLNQTNGCHGISWIRGTSMLCFNTTVRDMFGGGPALPDATSGFEAQLSTNVFYSNCRALRTVGSTTFGFAANGSTRVKYLTCATDGMILGAGYAINSCNNVLFADCESNSAASGAGYNIQVSDNVSISSGSSTSNVGNGIAVDTSTNVLVSNCQVSDNTLSGIIVTDSSTGQITGCLVSGSQIGINFLDDAAYTAFLPGLGSNRVISNTTADFSSPSAGYQTVSSLPLDLINGGSSHVMGTLVADGGLSTAGTVTIPDNSITEAKVTNLVSDLAAKATDSTVVHNTGAETVAGVKTFTSAPVVPSSSFPESAVTNLVSDLAAKATDSTVVHNIGAETVAGVKTFTAVPLVPAGGSVQTAAVDGIIHTRLSAISNTIATEFDLESNPLAANILGTNGDCVETMHTVTLTGGGGTKRIRIYTGATTVFDTGSFSEATTIALIFNTLRVRISATQTRSITSLVVNVQIPTSVPRTSTLVVVTPFAAAIAARLTVVAGIGIASLVHSRTYFRPAPPIIVP